MYNPLQKWIRKWVSEDLGKEWNIVRWMDGWRLWAILRSLRLTSPTCLFGSVLPQALPLLLGFITVALSWPQRPSVSIHLFSSQSMLKALPSSSTHGTLFHGTLF